MARRHFAWPWSKAIQRGINYQSEVGQNAFADRIGIVRKGELAIAIGMGSSESEHANVRAGLRGTAHPIVCNALYV